jgi:hypothetical protein
LSYKDSRLAIALICDGKFSIMGGPLPGIGGPFDTATAFFEAWADSVKFKWDKETITRYDVTVEKVIMIQREWSFVI